MPVVSLPAPSPAPGAGVLAPYDGILLVSFGGPERAEDVLPFLGNVTRGRGIPEARLAEVARHYLDRGGRSVLDIRPLLWKDGWPAAGDNFREGTYEIQSERSGFALELAVDFVRMDRGRRGGFGAPTGPATPVPAQELAQVSKDWPAGKENVQINQPY